MEDAFFESVGRRSKETCSDSKKESLKKSEVKTEPIRRRNEQGHFVCTIVNESGNLHTQPWLFKTLLFWIIQFNVSYTKVIINEIEQQDESSIGNIIREGMKVLFNRQKYNRK